MTIKSRQNYGAALRAIVWGVVFVFTLTSVTWTMPTAHANTTPSVRPGPVVPLKDLADVSLPAEIGKIRETYRGTSDKTVILIQDAHSIPDAQRSIQSAIDHFQIRNCSARHLMIIPEKGSSPAGQRPPYSIAPKPRFIRASKIGSFTRRGLPASWEP